MIAPLLTRERELDGALEEGEPSDGLAGRREPVCWE